MPWEFVGSTGTGEMPEDEEWILFSLTMAKKYIKFTCGDPPSGCKLDVTWQDHELGSYPALGIWYEDDLPEDYVNACTRAFDVFDEAVEWSDLHAHYQSLDDDEEEEEEEEEDEPVPDEDMATDIANRMEAILREDASAHETMRDLERILDEAGLVPLGSLRTDSPASFCSDLYFNLIELIGNWRAPEHELSEYETAEELLIGILP